MGYEKKLGNYIQDVRIWQIVGRVVPVEHASKFRAPFLLSPLVCVSERGSKGKTSKLPSLLCHFISFPGTLLLTTTELYTHSRARSACASSPLYLSERRFSRNHLMSHMAAAAAAAAAQRRSSERS